jgi:hypothetical protein
VFGYSGIQVFRINQLFARIPEYRCYLQPHAAGLMPQPPPIGNPQAASDSERDAAVMESRRDTLGVPQVGQVTLSI